MPAVADAGGLTRGDASILRFLAAAEILETDLWQQYQILARARASVVPGGSGSPAYTAELAVLDADMAQYTNGKREDDGRGEIVREGFLASKGADTISLD